MIKRIILLIALLLLSTNLFTIEITSSEGRLDESRNIDDDYIFYGERLNFTGSLDDLYFLGDELNFSGISHSRVTSLSDSIVIDGEVRNDLVSVSQLIEINGKVNGTSFIVADSLVVKGEMHGTLFSAAGITEIEGNVKGDIFIATGKLIIGGVVDGNIKAAADTLVFKDGGRVNGKIDFHSNRKMPEELKSYSNLNYVYRKDGDTQRRIATFFNVILPIFFFISFVLGGLLMLLLPITKGALAERDSRQFWFLSLWGLIPIFICPMVVIVLCITLIGIPLALLLLLAVLPFIFIAEVLGALLIGDKICNRLGWKISGRHNLFLLGAVVYLLLSLIPVIGIIGEIFVISLGCGLIIEKLFARKKLA